MSRYVPGYGPLDAKIVLVGEAPGEEEDRQGLPFVGGAGQELTKLLSSAGIDRNQCYLTNVFKLRPPSNNFGVLYNDTQRNEPSPTLTKAIFDLHAEIQRIRPNVVCCLGDEALRAVTGRRGITRWRGSILSSPCGKAVGTYHPAYILRAYSDWPIAQLDLRRVLQESRDPGINTPSPCFDIDPSFERVCELLSRRPKRIALDIETTKTVTRCIGIADDPDHAYCIPLMSSNNRVRPGDTNLILSHGAHTGMMNSHWTEDQEYCILRMLDELLRDGRVEKVLQNFPFDSTVLGEEFGLDIVNLWMDTLLAQHTCYPELPKGLDFLASVYTRIPYYSNYDPSDDRQTWIYNCWDCIATLHTAERLAHEMRALKVDEFYFYHVHPSIFSFTRTQNDGMLIDVEERTRQADAMRARIAELETFIRGRVGDQNFNPSSPKQVGEYLYGKLALRPVMKRNTQKKLVPTTDKNAMDVLAGRHPQHKEFFDAIKEHGSRETLLSGFLEHKLGNDRRIRTSYNIGGTVTGRLSSSEHFMFASTNLQNIERPDVSKGKIMRRCFLASAPDEVVVKADLGGAEWRIVCWLAPIKRFIERYIHEPPYEPCENPWDVHRWSASQTYQKLEEHVTKEERGLAKNGVYGGNYGMQPDKAALTWKVAVQTATFILNKYHQNVPEISQMWWPRVQSIISTTRTIVGPFGRKRIFYGRLDESMYRAAYSHSAQHIVGDIINRAFTLFDELARVEECRTLLQVHDEIVLSCKINRVRHYVELLRTLMQYPVQFDHVSQPLIIPADISVGPNWLDQEKYEKWIVKHPEQI